MDLVGVPTEDQWPTVLGAARRIEAAGFDSLWVWDHFHTVPKPTQESTLECWTLMAALAAATERVRLGQMCTCNSYRPPTYLAKVTSTIDVVSGGRLELGIGAGWYEHEYLAYGYEFPKASVRIGQLAEAVKIIKKMWTEDETYFEGQHYRVAGAINRPRPLQDPHPPLWVAGGGEKLTLRIVAEDADYSNFGGTTETFAKKSEILAQHCEAVGRDPTEIVRTMNFSGLVGADDDAVARAAAQSGQSPDQFLGSSMTVAGSPQEMVDRLGAYKDLGCGGFLPYFPDAVWGDSIERFAEEVVPHLR
jgi:F420-dependent oxidoreductase-like protein